LKGQRINRVDETLRPVSSTWGYVHEILGPVSLTHRYSHLLDEMLRTVWSTRSYAVDETLLPVSSTPPRRYAVDETLLPVSSTRRRYAVDETLSLVSSTFDMGRHSLSPPLLLLPLPPPRTRLVSPPPSLGPIDKILIPISSTHGYAHLQVDEMLRPVSSTQGYAVDKTLRTVSST
jgi:hypothetical protein